jgi:hypothetical protein
MDEGVAEHVRVEMFQTSLFGAAAKHLPTAVIGHIATAADPELNAFGKTVLAAYP